MCRSEKIENNLHRIESSERNLDKKGVPVAHRTIPETRKFQSLEFTTLIALRTDESCILINILQQIEALSLIVMETAYDIYWIVCVAEARAFLAWSSDMFTCTLSRT